MNKKEVFFSVKDFKGRYWKSVTENVEIFKHFFNVLLLLFIWLFMLNFLG